MSLIQVSMLKIFWLKSHIFFLFDKLSDKSFRRPNVSSFYLNFVLWLSWFCGLRINCLLCRQSLLPRSLRVLCVYEFISGAHARNFVALESYIFLFEKLSDKRFWRPNVSSFYLNFVIWLSWFCGLRINCLLCRQSLLPRSLRVLCVNWLNSAVLNCLLCRKTLISRSLRVLCVYEFNSAVQNFVL